MAELAYESCGERFELSREGFCLREVREATLISLQLFQRDEAARAYASAALGIESLPEVGDMAPLFDGECFGLPPADFLWWIEGRGGAGLLRRLQGALDGQLTAVHDDTHGQAILELSGERVWDVLARGCTLDFRSWRSGSSRAAMTRFANVPVLLLLSSSGSLRLIACRSLATYLHQWFTAATVDLVTVQVVFRGAKESSHSSEAP